MLRPDENRVDHLGGRITPNQANLIAVRAKGNTITLYINHQQIFQVNDSTYNQGQIGFVAQPYTTNGHPTEVAYSNAKVWTS